jgi:hypothetical protein
MVTDRIQLADVYERRAIDALGLDNASKFRFVNTPNRTYDWLEDTYVITSDTLTSSGGLASSSTTTTCLVTTPKAYNVGDVILIDSEYIWVSAVDTSGAQLTLVRNRGGTQATHANSTTVTIVSSARLEGADSDDSPTTEVTSTTNCSQIFQREVQISRSDKLFPNYGIADLEDYYIDKKMDELIMMLNRVPYHGIRQAGSSSHSQGRGAGGFEVFISTNTTAAGSIDLVRDHIDDQLENIYGYGGSPDALFCNTFQQRRLNAIYEGFIRTERSERTGGNRIELLEHPIGGRPIEIIVDRHCKTDTVYIISRKYAGYITIDPFFYEQLGKVGDAELGQVVGEYGFVVAFEKAHAYINGLTTS